MSFPLSIIHETHRSFSFSQTCNSQTGLHKLSLKAIDLTTKITQKADHTPCMQEAQAWSLDHTVLTWQGETPIAGNKRQVLEHHRSGPTNPPNNNLQGLERWNRGEVPACSQPWLSRSHHRAWDSPRAPSRAFLFLKNWLIFKKWSFAAIRLFAIHFQVLL